MRRARWYVGHGTPKPQAFRTDSIPTAETHPQYRAVVGPFRTRRAAQWAASDYAQGNPHYQTVTDAERIARVIAGVR